VIVKMQRPLNRPDGPGLMYSQDRSFETQFVMDGLMENLFAVFGLEQYGKAKLFAAVHLDKTRKLVIDDVFDTDLGW
jgi:hypothetical protein